MTPLVQATLAFAAGILAGLRAEVPAEALLAGCIAAVIVACVLTTRRPPTAPSSRHAPLAVYSLFALLGFVAAATASLSVRADCRTALPDQARVTIRGELAGAPAEDGAAHVRLRSVRIGGQEFGCGGKIRVRLPTPRQGARDTSIARNWPRPGQSLTGSGTWWAFPRRTGWPESPEWRGTLGMRALRVDPAARALSFAAMRGRAQERVRTLFRDQAGLAEALVLAERGGIEPAIRDDFTASGLTHLLSISGTHVGLVAGVLLLVGTVLRLPSAWAAILAATATVGYVLFLGAPHAAARAALQILLLLAARLAQRPSDSYTLLAFAGLVLLAADPLAALDAGFQLSFAGIFGLLALRRPILDRLPARLPGWLRDGLASGTAATLPTTPIAALHFGLVAWIGIIANLVAIPLVGLAVPAIALALIASTLSTSAAAFLASGGELLLAMLSKAAGFAARVPFGHGLVSRAAVLTWLAAVGAYVVASGIALRSRPERRRGRVFHHLAGAGAGLAVLLAGPSLPSSGSGHGVEIHAIDVGQGDAFAIRSPGGHWIVVDTGPRSEEFDAGRARVVPFLLERGVRRIDALLLTHPHADHIGGARALLDAFDVGVIVDPAVPFGQAIYAETLAEAREEKVRWVAAREGRELRFGDVSIRILAPLDDMLDASEDPNDYSLVFRLAYGQFGALFLGDAPMFVENRLVDRHGAALAAQFLKVGHHGSRTSTGDSLLAAVRPGVALVPVGRRNRYGHPDAGVMARLALHGVRALRTDERGTVTIRADARGGVTATSER